jgi:tetratricopeptide (TPR) repeat protein
LIVALQAADSDALDRARKLYGAGEFKQAGEILEKAVAQHPGDFELHLWLGRAYGRRAENSSFLTAPGLAVKARKSFERAVELNPRSREAGGDLFDYYMSAPGFLGGGVEKARAFAEKLKDVDPPEYHYRMAQLALKRKDLPDAEHHFRLALDLEPRNPGRLKDLAGVLAKAGHKQESDQLLRRAELLTKEAGG